MTLKAAVGFTVKSGWAAAVCLVGPASSPRVADSRTVDLSDPAIPDSRQPYHAGFGTARGSGRELTRLVASVERFGGRSIDGILQHYRDAGHHLRGVGLVVGSLIDPERIANDHIRIHALEGRLFRSVVQDAAQKTGLPSTVWRERDLYATACASLKQSEQTLRGTIAAMGRHVEGPWRAEQKAAAVAAWLVLAARR
jgi:hypothetical protein